MKVLFTSEDCNPSTITFECWNVLYLKSKSTIALFDKKGKLMGWSDLKEWNTISYIDENGKEHIIYKKGGARS